MTKYWTIDIPVNILNQILDDSKRFNQDYIWYKAIEPNLREWSKHDRLFYNNKRITVWVEQDNSIQFMQFMVNFYLLINAVNNFIQQSNYTFTFDDFDYKPSLSVKIANFKTINLNEFQCDLYDVIRDFRYHYFKTKYTKMGVCHKSFNLYLSLNIREINIAEQEIAFQKALDMFKYYPYLNKTLNPLRRTFDYDKYCQLHNIPKWFKFYYFGKKHEKELPDIANIAIDDIKELALDTNAIPLKKRNRLLKKQEYLYDIKVRFIQKSWKRKTKQKRQYKIKDID